MRLLLSVGILVIAASAGTRIGATPQDTAPPPAAAPTPPQQPATFRSGVDVMNLSVTVTDKKGKPVTDLAQDDFVVFEDKKPQPLVSFSSTRDATTAPVGLGLIIDGSASMT